MSKPEVIKIDDTEYVRKDSVKEADTHIKICVLDRGFVYVGIPSGMDTDTLLINRARNIRYWGTTQGLAELINGPTRKTVLDGSMIVRVPMRAVMQLIDVEQAPWQKHI